MARKNPFGKVTRVELEEGDWIEIRDRITASMFDGLPEKETEKHTRTAMLITLLVKNWSFVDEAGAMVPVTLDNVLNMESKTYLEIAKHVVEIVGRPKEKSQTSEQSSDQTKPTPA